MTAMKLTAVDVAAPINAVNATVNYGIGHTGIVMIPKTMPTVYTLCDTEPYDKSREDLSFGWFNVLNQTGYRGGQFNSAEDAVAWALSKGHAVFSVANLDDLFEVINLARQPVAAAA